MSNTAPQHNYDVQLDGKAIPNPCCTCVCAFTVVVPVTVNVTVNIHIAEQVDITVMVV